MFSSIFSFSFPIKRIESTDFTSRYVTYARVTYKVGFSSICGNGRFDTLPRGFLRFRGQSVLRPQPSAGQRELEPNH